MIKAGIVGGTGYGGVELVRLLQSHPHIQVNRLYSHSSDGSPLSQQYPHVRNIELPLLEEIQPERMVKENDVIFLATPAGVSSQLTPVLHEMGAKVIDLSGDLRLRDGEHYQTWYGKTPAPQSLLQAAVYGLHEWNREKIRTADVIANPGCYATAALLAVLPLIQANLVQPDSLILDAKSGVSGAGRGVSLGVHYAEVNESIAAYKIGTHQHVPEIEQTIQEQTGVSCPLQFTPHLVPMTRGILVTAYGKLAKPSSIHELQQIFEETYGTHPFMRLRPPGSYPRTKEVYGTNYCDLAVHLDERTGNVIVLSVIDNLGKGAAGQAVQNANTMFGLDETCGLPMVPLFP